MRNGRRLRAAAIPGESARIQPLSREDTGARPQPARTRPLRSHTAMTRGLRSATKAASSSGRMASVAARQGASSWRGGAEELRLGDRAVLHDLGEATGKPASEILAVLDERLIGHAQAIQEPLHGR